MNEISVDQALAKAKSFLIKGKTNEASDFYSFVLDRFPKNKRAHDGLVITHDILAGDHLGSIISEYNQGELATVVERVQSLTKKLTHASLLWNILGVAFNDQKRSEEAIQSLKTAISLKYDFAEAYFNIGSVFYERADYRAAINNFQQALKFKPQYFDALNNLGSAFRGVGELEAALRSFERAVKINPNNASTYFNVGVILHDQGNNEEQNQSLFAGMYQFWCQKTN